MLSVSITVNSSMVAVGWGISGFAQSSYHYCNLAVHYKEGGNYSILEFVDTLRKETLGFNYMPGLQEL